MSIRLDEAIQIASSSNYIVLVAASGNWEPARLIIGLQASPGGLVWVWECVFESSAARTRSRFLFSKRSALRGSWLTGALYGRSRSWLVLYTAGSTLRLTAFYRDYFIVEVKHFEAHAPEFRVDELKHRTAVWPHAVVAGEYFSAFTTGQVGYGAVRGSLDGNMQAGCARFVKRVGT